MIYLYSFLTIKKIKGVEMRVYCLSQWKFHSWEKAHKFRETEGIDPQYNPLYVFFGKPPLQVFEPL